MVMAKHLAVLQVSAQTRAQHGTWDGAGGDVSCWRAECAVKGVLSPCISWFLQRAMGVLTSTGKELQLGCQRAESLPALALSAAGTAST